MMLCEPLSYSAGCCPLSLEWVVDLKHQVSCGSDGPMMDHRLRNLESVGEGRVLLEFARLQKGCFPSLWLVRVLRVPVCFVLVVNALYGHPRLDCSPARVLSSVRCVSLGSVPKESGSVHSVLDPCVRFLGFGHPAFLSGMVCFVLGVLVGVLSFQWFVVVVSGVLHS